ncbi:2OG-Fe(II) oxygenase [Nonomuraea jiangxiensis]|nr:2OG-Fe(II) oxygenase [Nonomuraea jiangxiensis]
MAAAHEHDPFFVPVTADRFERRLLADLAAGRCAAIRVHDFFSPAECEVVMRALLDVEFATYGRARVQPEVMRFGVGVSDYRRDGRISEEFWAAVDEGRRAWEALNLPFDPFALCRSRLGADLPQQVEVGRHDGHAMSPGVAREPNQGFLVHFDDAQREFPGGFLDENVVCQFAFNLYLSVPEEGGETVVWRHRWHPTDDSHRPDGSYGFKEDVVGAAESFLMRPRKGEAVLLEPRNFHAVRPSKGGRRISLGFSVSMTDTGQLLTWG